MTEERSPLETALDLFVFAPVGMLLTLTEDLPKLVERGKGHLGSQLMTARVMGEMAAPQLRDEASKLIKGFLDRVSPPGPPAGTGPAARPAPTSSTGPAPSAPAGDAEATRAEVAPLAPAGSRGAGGPAITNPESLAIPGYDSLSAMQVVQRLAGLKQDELEAVRRYEAGHRHRKTIINRADQLLAEAG